MQVYLRLAMNSGVMPIGPTLMGKLCRELIHVEKGGSSHRRPREHRD